MNKSMRCPKCCVTFTENEMIRGMLKDGLSLKDIATCLCVSKVQAWRKIKKAGFAWKKGCWIDNR